MTDTTAKTTPAKLDDAAKASLLIQVAPLSASLKYQSFLGSLTPSDPTLRERGQGRGYELYDELRRDPIVFANLQKRSMALVGKPFSLRPMDETAAKADAGMLLAQKVVSTLKFDTLCHQLLDATLKGFSVVELMWRPDVWVEGFGYAWLPVAAIARDQNRFQFAQKQSPTNTLEGAGEFDLLLTDNSLGGLSGAAQGVLMPSKYKMIVHRYNSTAGDPYGHGIGSELYWPVFFSREIQAFWAEHLEKYGQPIPTAEYPDVGFDEFEQRKLAQSLQGMRRNGVVVHPAGVKITMANPGNAGAISYEQFLRYQDEAKMAIITGETISQGSGGAQGAAAADRRDVRGDIVKADGDLLSATLNDTLFKWIAELNGVPRCLVDRNLEQAEDIKRRSEVDQALFAMGWQPTPERIAQVYGQGYEAKAVAAALADGAGTGVQFAEGKSLEAQPDAVSEAAAALPADSLRTLQEGLVQQALASVNDAANFAEAESALAQAFRGMDTQSLEKTLARALFAAQTLAHAQGDAAP